MLEFSWQSPTMGHDFTTGFKLTCSPLLTGIPFPLQLSTTATAEITSFSVTELYPAVPYNCSIVTVSSQGESEPESVVHSTEEAGMFICCEDLDFLKNGFHILTHVIVPQLQPGFQNHYRWWSEREKSNFLGPL